MKIKRIAIMLLFAMIVVAVPILASVSGNGSTSQNQTPGGQARIANGQNGVLTFSAYGYGMLRVTRANGSQITYGATLPLGTQVTFHAEEAEDTGFTFVGWAVNGTPYMGPLSLTHTITLEEETHVLAFFDPPYGVEGPRAVINAVDIERSPIGGINISFSGHTEAPFEYYITDDEIEIALTPPAGRRFNDDTIVTAYDDLEITFGPILRQDGRMLLAIAIPHEDVQLPVAVRFANTEEANHTITFNLAGGNMPTGVPATQSHSYNSTINLPAPTRSGYTFSGWHLNGQLASTPLQVRNDMTLTATWTRFEAVAETTAAATAATTTDEEYYNYNPTQYVVNFSAGYGTFPGNESGLRLGTYGTVINNLPAAPTRAGYTFEGWQLPNGNIHVYGSITIRGDMTITAVWTPVPAASPSPSPSPTPTPAPSAPRPNPQTNPLQISVTIFGVVITLGLAVFGILNLAKKQMAAQGQYRADIARFNREKRIMDLVDTDTD